MQPVTNDATTAFLRALRNRFADFRAIAFEEVRSRSWASATFTGARHTVAFRLDGPGAEWAADAFLADLDTAEFRLRGHILADIALVSDERTKGAGGEPNVRIRLEALTVEDS